MARPGAWLTLAALALVVLAGAIWACVGSVPQQVSGPGLLTSAQGGFGVQSTASGQVGQVFVRPLRRPHTGTPQPTSQAAAVTDDSFPSVSCPRQCPRQDSQNIANNS